MGSNFEPFYLQHQHCQGSIMAVRLRSAPTFGLWAQGRPSEFASLKECKMLMSDDDDDCTHLSSRSVGRSRSAGCRRDRHSLGVGGEYVSGQIIAPPRPGPAKARSRLFACHALLVSNQLDVQHEGQPTAREGSLSRGKEANLLLDNVWKQLSPNVLFTSTFSVVKTLATTGSYFPFDTATLASRVVVG